MDELIFWIFFVPIIAGVLLIALCYFIAYVLVIGFFVLIIYLLFKMPVGKESKKVSYSVTKSNSEKSTEKIKNHSYEECPDYRGYMPSPKTENRLINSDGTMSSKLFSKESGGLRPIQLNHEKVLLDKEGAIYKESTSFFKTKGDKIAKVRYDGMVRESSSIFHDIFGGETIGELKSDGKINKPRSLSDNFFGREDVEIGSINTSKDKESSSCFLTTACVKAKKLPDDCFQLEVLRNFRDRYVLKLEDGPKMIQEYYQSAPLILEAIEKENNPEKIYNQLFTNLVEKCVKLIQQDKKEEAVVEYKKQVTNLKNKYLKNVC